MTLDAPVAADKSLSVEEAVGLLDRPEEQPDDPAPAAGAPEPAEAELGEAELEPVPNEAAQGEDEDRDDPGEAPMIAPPRSWDADARAAFARLTPEIQQTIARQESERERAVSRAQQEAGDARRRAEQEAGEIGRLKGALDQLIRRGQATFQDRWADFDQNFPALVDQFGADQALKWRAVRDVEHAELARLDTAQQETARQQRARFLDAEGRRLAQLSPELADPDAGGARRERLAGWLIEQGVPREVIPDLDARTVALAYDAMRFRTGAHRLREAKARPAPAPARPGARPTAAQASRPQSRTVETARSRFAQSRSVDDAVALLNARLTNAHPLNAHPLNAQIG